LAMTDLISIAKVTKSWGNRGEVIADLLTDFPDRFRKLKKVLLQEEGQSAFSLALESFRLHNRRIVLKFCGVDDITTAEGLRDHEIRIAKKDILDLPEDCYYQFDLINCFVRDLQGCTFGKVTDVLEMGGYFLLNLRCGEKEMLVPFAKDIVLEVDLSRKELICNIPEGLEDL